MVIVVRDKDVRLDDPDDFKGFKVVVESGDGSGLFAVGRLAHRDTAWIQADAVRRLAGDAATRECLALDIDDDTAWHPGPTKHLARLGRALGDGCVPDAGVRYQVPAPTSGDAMLVVAPARPDDPNDHEQRPDAHPAAVPARVGQPGAIATLCHSAGGVDGIRTHV